MRKLLKKIKIKIVSTKIICIQIEKNMPELHVHRVKIGISVKWLITQKNNYWFVTIQKTVNL